MLTDIHEQHFEPVVFFFLQCVEMFCELSTGHNLKLFHQVCSEKEKLGMQSKITIS